MAVRYTVEEERRLEEEVGRGEVPRCPRCEVRLHATPVPPSTRVAYVRRRVVLQCPSCGRRAVVDGPRS